MGKNGQRRGALSEFAGQSRLQKVLTTSGILGLIAIIFSAAYFPISQIQGQREEEELKELITSSIYGAFAENQAALARTQGRSTASGQIVTTAQAAQSISASDVEGAAEALQRLLTEKEPNFSELFSVAESLDDNESDIQTDKVVGFWMDVGDLALISEPDIASDAYQRALRLDPNNARVWMNVGRAQSRLRKDDDALYSYTKALELSSRNSSIRAWAHRNLAALLFNKNQYRDALKHSEQSIEIYENLDNDAKVAEVRALQGHIALGLEEFDIAFQFLTMGVDAAKENENIRSEAVATSLLGEWARRTGRPDESREYFTRAIALYGLINDKAGITEGYLQRAYINSAYSKFTDGMSDTKEAYRIAEEIGDQNFMFRALFQQGVNYDFQRRFNERCEVWDEARDFARSTNLEDDYRFIDNMMRNVRCPT